MNGNLSYQDSAIIGGLDLEVTSPATQSLPDAGYAYASRKLVVGPRRGFRHPLATVFDLEKNTVVVSL
jgi:hypothetical protein